MSELITVQIESKIHPDRLCQLLGLKEAELADLKILYNQCQNANGLLHNQLIAKNVENSALQERIKELELEVDKLNDQMDKQTTYTASLEMEMQELKEELALSKCEPVR